MLRILVIYGPEEQVFAIPETEAHLGSSPQSDIVLRFPGVSRRHALVRRVSGGVEVLDLRSKNGLLVEGQLVKQTTITPGLRVQIGSAWLELEEISTSEEALARLRERPSGLSVRSSPMTTTVEAQGVPESHSPSEAALVLAYHIAQIGVGVPEKRTDLLLRIKGILGAEALATLERTRSGRLRIWESTETFSPEEIGLVNSLTRHSQIPIRGQAILKRVGKILLAGRDSWFLAARFSDETLAHEVWRKELLRFLALQFFIPVRDLRTVVSLEASRVFSLARANAKRTAELLGISRNTLSKLLARLGLPKS
jgi:hypothetical protein